MGFTFIHAADLHLDTPFSGLGAADPAVAQALRDASLEAWDHLIELAIRRGAAFVVLAGDLYDGQQRGVRAQLRVLAGLKRLAQAGIQAFIVHGNHDPLGGWSAIRDWPDNVTVFGSDQVASVAVRRDGQELACVHGISYGRPDVSENLALRFARPRQGGLHVGLLHCNVGGRNEHGPYSPCTLDDLQAAGMDYWALGHIHQRSELHPRKPHVVYPGNLQGRSPKPSECGPKGAVVVEVEPPAGVRKVEFVPLDRARFVWAEVDIAGLGDLAGLRAACDERAEQLRAEHSGRLLLVRAALTGAGELHDQLARRSAALDELRKELCDAHRAGPARAGIWWESLADQSRCELNLEAIRERGDFLAEVLRRAEALAANPAELDAFADEHLAGLDRPRAALGELTLASPSDALSQACRMALEMLSQEGDA